MSIANVTAVGQSEALEIWRQNRDVSTLPSGISSLDALTGGGLPVGQLTIVLGYTGVGKSELVRQFRRAAIASGHPVIHIDVELGLHRIMERELCQIGQINAHHLRNRLLTAEEQKGFVRAEKQLQSEVNVWTICPGGSMHPAVLSAALEAVIAECKGKMPLIILDSLQRLALGASIGEGQRIQTQNFMLWAEQFSHSHKVAMLMTSEQRRPPPGIEVSIEDALGSGAESRAIEFYADLLMSMQPCGTLEEVDPDEKHDRVVKLAVLKNRSGSCGWLAHDLVFEYPHWGFRLRAKDTGHVTEAKIEQAWNQLRPGMKYTVHDLRDLWRLGANNARTIIAALTEQSRLVKIGKTYGLPCSEVADNFR